MKLKTILGVLVFGAFSSQVFAANQTEAEFIAKAKADVKLAMTTLQTKLQALGDAKLEGTMKVGKAEAVPVIFFGKEKINLNYKIVDEVKKAHGGTATVFVKKAEGDFVRVSTNVMKDGESRAIGTSLGEKDGKIDVNNPALVAIKAGQEFEGVAHILNADYQTKYAPIFAADKKTVLGIYYVGYPLPAIKEAAPAAKK